jgi:hypothetical protein
MGNPYNMRNKRRDKTGRGPLALFIEMTGSAGLAKDDMVERGAALFALVQALSLARPRIISPGSQIAYMPAGLLGADDFTDPNEWIRQMLRKYSPYLLSGDDREDVEA